MEKNTNAYWKNVYQQMFENTPKNKRRTKAQINNIRSKSKIFASLYKTNL